MRRVGDTVTQLVPKTCRATLEPYIKANVRIGAIVHTVEHRSYADPANAGYRYARAIQGAMKLRVSIVAMPRR